MKLLIIDKALRRSPFIPQRINAEDPADIKEVIKKNGITFVMNAVEPFFNETIFDVCFETGVGYLDCAMTLSKPHPEKPFELPHIKLGDYQFERHEAWKKADNIAIAGSGVEPGMVDVFVHYTADHFFDTIDGVNIRDGAGLPPSVFQNPRFFIRRLKDDK